MKKKLIWIIAILVCVAVVAGAGIGIYAHFYNNQNHADNLNNQQLRDYNHLLTAFGRNNKLIANDEVLVLDTVTKNLGGDTEASFLIYRYKNESDLTAALQMTPEQIAENDAYEFMGNGTVTLLDDKFSGMVNMKTRYIK